MVCVVRDKPLQKIWRRGVGGGGGREFLSLRKLYFRSTAFVGFFFGRGGGGVSRTLHDDFGGPQS